MSPRRALLAVLPLGLLGACREVGTSIAVPANLPLPPEALLEPPSIGAAPTDRRFADALVAYAAVVHALPSDRGGDAQVHIREALRLLAGAVALVPGRPELREPAYRVATELRVTTARMATDFVTEPRTQTAHARRALEILVTFLLDVVTPEYATAPDVLARMQAFAAAVHAVDPDRIEPAPARMIAALTAAEGALEAMLRAALSAPH